MKKNVLAVSIAAMIGGLGFAGVASAATVYPAGAAVPGAAAATTLEVTPEGVGHILLVPYFSTQDGNVSLLNIVNTDTVNGKAIKLRYRGAANSDDIYDITLLLSPGDVWSAEVSNQNGVSTLKTNDNSCTLPANVNATFSAERTRNKDVAQTLEGYIEILNMADVPATLANVAGDGSLSAAANPLYTAIKHVNGVAPCATIPSQLKDVAAAGTGADAWNTRGYNFPTGGLMANWSIINLAKAGSFTGDATAIAARVAIGDADRAAANLVFSPQDSTFQPSDAVADAAFFSPKFLTADPLLAGGATDSTGATLVPAKIKASFFDFPDLSTPYVTAPSATAALDQAHFLSAALATVSVTNEFMTSPVVSFATDWTFSMPSRRYNVALDYTSSTAVYAVNAEYFTEDNTSLSADKSQICVKPGALEYRDTSEQSAAGGSYVISPRPIGDSLAFCGETSVLTFNNTNGSVLGAKIASQNIATKKDATTTFTDGWLSVQTPGNAGLGLPVVGHAFAKALGTSVSLGGIWKHRTNRSGL